MNELRWDELSPKRLATLAEVLYVLATNEKCPRFIADAAKAVVAAQVELDAYEKAKGGGR